MTEHSPIDTLPRPVRLRVEDYLLLDEAGAFVDYAKTELIGGEIYAMSPQHRPHARVKSRLHLLLANALLQGGSTLETLVEASVEMPPSDVPMPDIIVTDEAGGEGLVPVASVRLIVEVSDATIASDLTQKAATYALHGVPEYWVADVNAGVIHQMWAPADGAYRETRRAAFGGQVRAEAVTGLAIETGALR